jgi:hypothetical protein
MQYFSNFAMTNFGDLRKAEVRKIPFYALR